MSEQAPSSSAPRGTADRPIRVLMQQAAMPAFRVPYYRSLANRPGIDLTVLYGTIDLPNVEPEGFKAEHRLVKRLPGGLVWDAAHLSRLKPGAWDALSLSWNTRYLSLFVALRRARKLGVGTVVWGHGYSKSEGPVRAWLRFKAGQMADAVVLYSESVAADYVRRGMPKEKVFVALNSLDPTPIQAAREKILSNPDALAAFKREHGLGGPDGTAPVILYVSRLDPNNRVPMLVEATKKLLPEFPELRTVVIGKGPDLENVKQTAERLGVTDRVICPGAVYGEEAVGLYFCAADVFCYPANIGLSILHAMNHALPVVTSDKIDAQNPEIEALADGENGLLYKDGDVDDLTAKLATLLRDGELRQRLSANAHATATERYNTDRMADGMEAALRYAYAKAQQRR
ncbi:MAG: glycosyltransferase family 4 protein [Phycisphaerales bacterium]